MIFEEAIRSLAKDELTEPGLFYVMWMLWQKLIYKKDFLKNKTV